MKKLTGLILFFCLVSVSTIASPALPPEIIATPTAITIPEGTMGFASAAASYTLSAHDLVPADGDIYVTSIWSQFEMSANGSAFSQGLIIHYTNGQLAATTISVRTSNLQGVGFGTEIISNELGTDLNVRAIVNATWSVVPLQGTIWGGPPNITGLSASQGFPSDISSFIFYAELLYPTTGHVTVSGTNYLEFSEDGVNFFPTLTVDYMDHGEIFFQGSSVSTAFVMVRISSAAPSGPFSGIITVSGGAAAPLNLTVNGGISRMYYNTNAQLGLNDPGSWSSTIDGTGEIPDFSQGYCRLNVVDPTNTSINGVWNIAFPFSSINVGDGINPINLVIPAGADSITSATKIDLNNNATLTILNNRIPSLNNIDIGSTVNFAQAGLTAADIIRIPSATYGTLRLTNGLKYFTDGLSVGGDLIVDGVVSINGQSGPTPSVVTCYADITFLNGAAFEPDITGASSRFVLATQKGTGVQNITSNGTVLKLLLLRRDNTVVGTINLSAGTEMQLGGTLGGGLYLKSANSTLSTTGGKISFVNAGAASMNNSLGLINSNGTSFEMFKNATGNYPVNTSLPGKLIFTPGSLINNFSVNLQNYTPAYDNIAIANDVTITGALNLQEGKIVVNTGATLSLSSSASLTGGSTLSYIDGALKRTGPSAFTFPMGNAGKYAPVDLSNYTGTDTYTVLYMKENYPVHTIDPATLAVNPLYDISAVEYWNITPATTGSTVDIKFHYTDNTGGILDPAAVGIAHFDGTDWNDIGGTTGASNSLSSGDVFVTAVSSFSPFTFGGTAGIVVPVKLTGFTAIKQDKVVKLNWITEQETNSATFIVERSVDGRSWNELTRVNAAGNSSSIRNYNATDFNPAKGINYYRLKQVDLAGKSSYSEIRPVYFGTDATIVLAPNPTHDKVTVYLPGNSEPVSIKIYNVNGQVVKQVSCREESMQINIPGFSKGIYTISVNGKNINAIKKLLVE